MFRRTRFKNGRIRCGLCKRYKEPRFFHVHRTNGNKWQGYCKNCDRVRQRGKKRYRRFREHDMEEWQYDALVYMQGGRCLVCRKEKPLVIDHDHRTGEIRGLLCLQCNHGIGLLYESKGNFQRAMDYV